MVDTWFLSFYKLPPVSSSSALSRSVWNNGRAHNKGNLCNGSTPHFDCGSIGSSPVFPASVVNISFPFFDSIAVIAVLFFMLSEVFILWDLTFYLRNDIIYDE